MGGPRYFVLAALLDGRRHGYAIIKQVEDLSGGQVRLAAGTLYALLDRLAADGHVESDGAEVVNGRARRYYVLTERGSAALRQEAVRMAAAARVVTERVTLPGLGQDAGAETA
ncbi:hypothetical protein Val02_21890 [Virgisporangium aliadipatigenens]|uniref:Transcription regulator PadR N-terminal domain-containing protein n=1 Tax=Virgisporangium aliadipatigenens TaxID=741659 RepID=A0A8J3YJJ6_9ACTN|nr:PadR family transcriptional regulator [Virgisporangium aliadipatigenens]GIJ45303.1 hypothetical protein Val02_21890 [Virgisporangium aliadipatigenens]